MMGYLLYILPDIQTSYANDVFVTGGGIPAFDFNCAYVYSIVVIIIISNKHSLNQIENILKCWMRTAKINTRSSVLRDKKVE